MLKKSLILLFFTLSFLLVSAQKTKSLKLYANSSMFSNSSEAQGPDGPILIENVNGGIGGFSPALFTQLENGRYHEFELSGLRLNVGRNQIRETDTTGQALITSGSRVTNINLSMRFEVGKNWGRPMRRAGEGMIYGIGVGIQPYLGLFRNNSLTSTQFNSSGMGIGARIQAIPRVMFINDKSWFIDLNIPITFVDISYSTNRNENPILPNPQQRTQSGDLELLPFILHVRLGVGVRL